MQVTRQRENIKKTNLPVKNESSNKKVFSDSQRQASNPGQAEEELRQVVKQQCAMI